MNPAKQEYTVLCTGSPQEKAFGILVAKEFGLAHQLGQILYSRGIATAEQAQAYLYPQLSSLPLPDTMKGMGAAVACIAENYRKNRPIFIHGDYDVDGITATALLLDFFREIGQESYYYIPNRLEERYGLSIHSLDRLLSQCPNKKGVVISVDCGITSISEVEYVKHLGHRMVVTDHHTPQDTLPRADALLNPKQKGCTFPCPWLSGAGVAFYLITALRRALAIEINLKQYLDLVALGTVADVMPLVGVNRVLVRAGLEVLSARNRKGIASLCCQCGLEEGRALLAEDIAFKLAPRINASGRLGCPKTGVELLIARNTLEAERAALVLDRLNGKRKELEHEALPEIDARCAAQLQAGAVGLVAYKHDCHPGLLGIMASRIAERYNRPALVFTDSPIATDHGLIKGSGRSIKRVDLFQVLARCSSVVEQFGGHAMAVGITLKKARLAEFSRMFNAQLPQIDGMLDIHSHVLVDYAMTGEAELTRDLARSLQWMQPFGEGNTEPVFMLAGQRLHTPRVKNGHVLFQLQGGGHCLAGVGFHLARSKVDLDRPNRLIFQLKQTWFRGKKRDQVIALNISPC